MAEQIGKHVWSTPKAGITFAKKYFEHINKPTDYKFIIIRNPYHRIVSFYINKIIWRGQNSSTTDITINTEYEIPIPHYEKYLTSLTFEWFVLLLINEDFDEIERHLQLQSFGVYGEEFDTIVKLENFKEDIREVCTNLELDYEYISNLKPINESIKSNIISDSIYSKKPSWFRQNGVPTNYDLFFNDELRDIVHHLYYDDFKNFNYTK